MLPQLERAGIAPIAECAEPIETNRTVFTTGPKSASLSTGMPALAEGLAAAYRLSFRSVARI
jgi:hypothetical protein